MKKCVSICIALILLLASVPVQAFPTPLESAPRWTVVVFEDSPVSLISYKAYLTIGGDVTTIRTSSVIKNTADVDVDLRMGMPQLFDDEKRRIENLKVNFNGRDQKTSLLKDTTITESTNIKDLPKNWHVWNVKLAPGENKVIDCSFTLKNINNNGVGTILLPLEFIRPWNGPVQYIEVFTSFDSYSPQILEPYATNMPSYYNQTGDMSWNFYNLNVPQDIRFNYISIDESVAVYIETHAPGDKKINAILKDYLQKDYDTVINEINDYLSVNTNTQISKELMFLKALSHQALYDLETAVNLFQEIRMDPDFLQMNSILRNKSLYEGYKSIIDQYTDDKTELYEYLIAIEPFISGNDTLALYLKDQVNMVPKPSTPEPTTPSEPESTQPETSSSEEDQLVKVIEIAGITVPVEFIFLGLAVALILLIIIIRRKKRKKKNYLFR